jgi:DMSO/TMAO reductase YedYZ heme-binding membrane subunit
MMSGEVRSAADLPPAARPAGDDRRNARARGGGGFRVEPGDVSSVSVPSREPVALVPREGVRILGGAVALVLVTVVGTLALHGAGEQGLGLVTRHLARLAFPFFLAAFSASALAELAPSRATLWLLLHRRWIGLGFAIVMFAHLSAIFVFLAAREAGNEVDVSQVLGAVGFVAIAVMAATSNDAAVRALGRARWSRLHRACLYYVWFIVTATYLGRVAEDRSYVLFLVLSLAALGLRIAAWRHRRRPRQPAACPAG